MALPERPLQRKVDRFYNVRLIADIVTPTTSSAPRALVPMTGSCSHYRPTVGGWKAGGIGENDVELICTTTDIRSVIPTIAGIQDPTTGRANSG